jgi:acetyl esterase/lipase
MKSTRGGDVTIRLDPELAVPLAREAEAARRAGTAEPPARGDVAALRELTDASLHTEFAAIPASPDVASTYDRAEAPDGAAIELRWYTREGARPGPAVVHLHGGGMIAGSVELYDPLVREYVQSSGVPFLAVEYRLAPHARGEQPARDALTGIRWLLDHAADLEVDPARVAVMGDSAGGGVAAAAAILARDAGIALARQILVYPMLDDRTGAPDPDIADAATWSHDMNDTAWRALLGDAIGTDAVSPIAAPGRLADAHGLAPAYIEVGTLDLFRDECIRYAQTLLAGGVDVELHVHPGIPHGHDSIAPEADVSRRSAADRLRVICAL